MATILWVSAEFRRGLLLRGCDETPKSAAEYCRKPLPGAENRYKRWYWPQKSCQNTYTNQCVTQQIQEGPEFKDYDIENICLNVGYSDIIVEKGRPKGPNTVSTVSASIDLGTQFPSAAVADCLKHELIEGVKEDATIKGVAIPANADDILLLPTHIDSLVVVAILCAIEPIVGFELPEDLVRTGGYRSVSTALDHLLPRIEKEWIEKKGAKS